LGVPETNVVRGMAGRGETPKRGWAFVFFYEKVELSTYTLLFIDLVYYTCF
jgi:hypothetical protein